MNRRIDTFEEMTSYAGTLPRKTVAVVYPNNEETFGAIAAARNKLNTRFILAGNATSIRKGLAPLADGDDGISIIDCSSPETALAAAIEAVGTGSADILMKGSIDTASLMRAAVRESGGLRTGGLMSDVFLFENPRYEPRRIVMITDGGVNLHPGLREKADLIRNAAAVAHALGNTEPRVAVLAATEFVTPKLPSTVEAAELEEMNKRGEITGCIVEGPLALDVAFSEKAAAVKGISSRVAGKADILVAPDIDAANSLAKSAVYFGRVYPAHVIVGARVPILIPSRSDTGEAKLLSVALGMVMSEHIKNTR